ncbi:MAG: hypothetical protein R3320_08145 [Nitriliruptorales bacterium]|nr:hypothetical protein [Nitriliruptorales bacterium]
MTGPRQDPWWASDNGGGLGDEDPFDAHRSARSGRERRTSDAFRELFRALGEGRHRLDSETCGVCPLCTAIASLDQVRPEVVQHLSEAARHLTLAAKSFVDAQAEAHGPTDLEHIEVEEEPGS